jgi:DNA-directed RNA polymerase specialized sigma24 family protein
LSGFKERSIVHNAMAEAGDLSGSTHGGGNFPPTHWSIVLAAAQAGSPEADQALAKLCETYWYPLYAFARRQGSSPSDAEDLTQAFFLHLLQKNTLAAADRARGRFRNFLLTALKHFLINAWHRGQAKKQGGGHVLVPLDTDSAETRYGAEPADDASPEKLYDRNWAWTLLDRVLARLRAELEADGKGALFDRLKPALMGEPIRPSSAEVAAEFKLTKPALRMAVHRLRRRFRKLLREEIAPTVASPEEIDDEIRHLFAALGDG